VVQHLMDHLEWREAQGESAGMTTNAIDQRGKMIASDSRWSISAGNLVFYVDDTGFDKIADRAEGSLICAGDAGLIQRWRDWFMLPVPMAIMRPPTEDTVNGQPVRIAITVLQKPDASALFSKGEYLMYEDFAFFSGSGAQYARDCFSANGCSKRAVASAGQEDPLTGGETKFVELATNANNLSAQTATAQEAYAQLLQRGSVMDTATKKVVPIQDAATANASAVRAVQGGQLPLSAPSGKPIAPWSEKERKDLDAALAKLFAKQA